MSWSKTRSPIHCRHLQVSYTYLPASHEVVVVKDEAPHCRHLQVSCTYLPVCHKVVVVKDGVPHCRHLQVSCTYLPVCHTGVVVKDGVPHPLSSSAGKLYLPTCVPQGCRSHDGVPHCRHLRGSRTYLGPTLSPSTDKSYIPGSHTVAIYREVVPTWVPHCRHR